MVKRLNAICLLIMMLVIQVGNVGFSYYQITCLSNHTTSYSLQNSGCCCKAHQVETNKKACCKKKKVSCCAADNAEQLIIKKNCCNSEKHSFVINATDFDQQLNEFQINKPLDTPTHLQVLNAVEGQVYAHNQSSNYHCNSPPLRNYNSRIFIQSFQI